MTTSIALRYILISTIVFLGGCGRETDRTPAAPSSFSSPSVPTRPAAVTVDITFTADSSCAALPVVARSRRYSAAITTGTPIISLGGATFGRSSDGGYPSLWNVIYQSPSQGHVNWWFQDPEIWEFLDATSYVAIFGGPVAVSAEPGVTTAMNSESQFWGVFTYCAEAEPDNYPECAVPETSCESTHHVLIVRTR